MGPGVVDCAELPGAGHSAATLLCLVVVTGFPLQL